MPGVSRVAVALLPALLSASIQAATPLPDAPAVQAAMRRAIQAEIPPASERTTNDFGEALILGRLLSIEVVDVPGCVPLQADRLNCIVSFDKGFGQIRHRAMHLEKRDGQWEILRPGPDPAELAPPAPTPAQAQTAVRAHANEQLARGVEDEELRQAATDFHALALSDCSLNDGASVACDVEFSWPAASGAAEIRTSRMRFRLQGDQWRYE